MIIPSASEEVIPFNSSDQRHQHKQSQEPGDWEIAMRQESVAGLRGWDLVQGPGERSALGMDWRSGGLVGGWDKGPGDTA